MGKPICLGSSAGIYGTLLKTSISTGFSRENAKPVAPHGRRRALIPNGGGYTDRSVRVSASPAHQHLVFITMERGKRGSLAVSTKYQLVPSGSGMRLKMAWTSTLVPAG